MTSNSVTLNSVSDSAETDELEEHPFFHYYGMCQHQQNMLQDYVRTGTYHEAIIQNIGDFKDKVILDVGTGTGILSFFAAQAFAKHIYAVEISKMASYAKKLVTANRLESVIEVIHGKVEEMNISEKVDVIISEPMGFFLVHERMLEAFMTARDRFLKPGGKMFPSNGTIYLSAFSDQALYDEQFPKVEFWKQKDFYGVDISELYSDALRETFSQPVVGYFNSSQLVTNDRATHKIDFQNDALDSLYTIDIPFNFLIDRPCIINGLANWFDVCFNGTNNVIILSTSPESDYTHWYQCRLLFPTPIAANPGQYLSGKLHMTVNLHRSYGIEVDCKITGTTFGCHTYYNLHDQLFQYLQQPAQPAQQ